MSGVIAKKMGAFDILFCVPMCLKVIFSVGASPSMSYPVPEFSIRECIPYVEVIKPTKNKYDMVVGEAQQFSSNLMAPGSVYTI